MNGGNRVRGNSFECDAVDWIAQCTQSRAATGSPGKEAPIFSNCLPILPLDAPQKTQSVSRCGGSERVSSNSIAFFNAMGS